VRSMRKSSAVMQISKARRAARRFPRAMQIGKGESYDFVLAVATWIDSDWIRNESLSLSRTELGESDSLSKDSRRCSDEVSRRKAVVQNESCRFVNRPRFRTGEKGPAVRIKELLNFGGKRIKIILLIGDLCRRKKMMMDKSEGRFGAL
jgi:hypothetical protein